MSFESSVPSPEFGGSESKLDESILLVEMALEKREKNRVTLKALKKRIQASFDMAIDAGVALDDAKVKHVGDLIDSLSRLEQ